MRSFHHTSPKRFTGEITKQSEPECPISDPGKRNIALCNESENYLNKNIWLRLNFCFGTHIERLRID
jgi:hypothetical protein